ncbi:hypothetical protein [Streptomyces sp. NBRC 110611]|uniref:hypothetical protein n=1 Tax=Streptomyces sp. NBRC 110611 TaxID=1621259 RepID=UPI0037DA2E9B
MIDLCSRRLADWVIADHMRSELVVDALAAAERDPRQPRWRRLSHRSRGAVHQPGVRRRLPEGRRDPGHERGREPGGKRRRGELRTRPSNERRSRAAGLVQRARSTTRGVPVAALLQHRPPPLPPRTLQPERLRDGTRHDINYPHRSCISRVQDSG